MRSKKLIMLEKKIRNAQKAYYFGTPVMSDATYDALVERLRILDENNALLRQVGAKLPQSAPLRKVAHTIAMGSQSKVNTLAAFQDWAKKTEAQRFVVQEKLDGLSVELVYDQGRLVVASTRGDGTTGEDITHNVVAMQNAKVHLPGFSGSLRGEIIITDSTFRKVFAAKKYANPRNAAAGVARRKVQKNAKHLIIYYFDVLPKNHKFKTEFEKIQYIKRTLQLKAVNCWVGDSAFVEKAYADYVEKHRKSLPYAIDGLVVKVNNLSLQRNLGVLHNRPIGQIAWKFEAEYADTRIRGIHWAMGLTGRLTPVAVLEPVHLCGTVVRRASLHTWKNISSLGINVNDCVRVAKRGDIIPQIECKVASAKESVRPFDYPKSCPVCNQNLGFEGEFLSCLNICCPAKLKGDFLKWAKVFELDYVGESFVEKLFDLFEIKGIWQLYALAQDQIEALPGFGTRSAERVFAQIHGKKEVELVTFLSALNIPNISVQTFQNLVDAGYDTVEKMQNMVADEIQNISGFGKITADQVVYGLAAKKITITKLLKYIKIKSKITGPLTGKSFCFTGEISIKRPLAQKLVKDNGGIVKTSVVKGLTYLVQADANSQTTKTQKAKENGITVISGDDFLRMVNFDINLLERYSQRP